MKKPLAIGLAALGVAGAAWFGPGLLAPGGTGSIDVPDAPTVGEGARGPDTSGTASKAEAAALRTALNEVRLGADMQRMDAFVAEQRARAESAGDDPEAWRLLAEAHLERCLLRDQRKGMAVATATHEELPAANKDDIEAGLAAAQKALELGDPTGDAWRIRSSLLSISCCSLGDFLRLRSPAQEAMDEAAEIDPDNPRVVMARATEKLFAPRFFGNDPEGALPLLERAVEALPQDERPLLFTAFAHWLLERPEQALQAAEAAQQINPRNVYVAAVVERLRGGEEKPFARDVE